MQWLNNIVDEVIARNPDGEVLVSSGGSPSGTYHLGHLRELITADAILLELRRRGRDARHIYYADDLDALRKIPVNISSEYEKYLGRPLCDIPAPEAQGSSYADYFLAGLVNAAEILGLDMQFIKSHEQYRAGFFVPSIEKALEHSAEVKNVLETISGHRLDETWSPIQINEDGYLKKRRFINIDTTAKTVAYEDKEAQTKTIKYDKGDVKLDWRIDWPARWWQLKVSVEPFGRDHATKGGSFDTGLALMEKVFQATPPVAVPYDFVNMTGDTKKMSASKGTGLDAVDGAKLMPPEVVRYFILRSPPAKRLYFDPINGVIQLMDEYAALAAKPESDQTEEEKQLLYICTHGQAERTVSRLPFSHLVASYQAALRNAGKTLEVIRRTEHAQTVAEDEDIIKKELIYIDRWLDTSAPEDVKFSLLDQADASKFSKDQKLYLAQLAAKIEAAPEGADGEWFHKAIYDFKDSTGLSPKELFAVLYQVLIGKDSGPRAGWFLSLLPREWLILRLKLQA